MVNITGPKGRAFNSPARKGVAQRLVKTSDAGGAAQSHD